MSKHLLIRSKNTDDIYVTSMTDADDPNDVIQQIRAGDFDSRNPGDYEYMLLEFQFQPTHVLSPETLKTVKAEKPATKTRK